MSAVLVYVAVYYTLLYVRRRNAPEFLAFGLLSTGFALLGFADAWWLQAKSIDEAVLAHRVGDIGIIIGVTYYGEFTATVTRRRDLSMTLAYVWAVCGILLVVSGLYVEPAPHFAWLARSTPLGTVHMVGLWSLGTWFTWRVIRLWFSPDVSGLLVGPTSRLLVTTVIITLSFAIRDVGLRSGALNTLPLLEVGAALVLLSMSYALLERYVQSTDRLREKSEELARSHAALRDARDRLVRKEQLAAVGELAATVANEVRGPLAMIKNVVASLRRDSGGHADEESLLAVVSEDAARLRVFGNNLALFSRAERANLESLLLRPLLTDLADELPSEFEMQVECPSTVRVQADAEVLLEVLRQIVSNAVDAMPSGGTISVLVRVVAAEVFVSISDTGQGLDALVRARSFTPFFSTKPMRTGLGLAIVETAMRACGGRVQISSQVGAGTTVELVFRGEAP